MKGRLLLKNCSIYGMDGHMRNAMAVVIEGQQITNVLPEANCPILPGDWAVKCHSRLVSPGLIDCHTRLVGGSLTRALAPQSARRHFACARHIQKTLTASEVEAITAGNIARALKQGTTTFVEHLHAPLCVEKALKAQAHAAERIGARLINSHASNSHIENAPGIAQLEANARYIESRTNHPLVRGAVGIWAAFCADDELLQRAGQVREALAVGVHVLLAENHATAVARQNKRFERFGLFRGGASVAAGQMPGTLLSRSHILWALTPCAVASEAALGMAARQHALGLGSCGRWNMAASAAAYLTQLNGSVNLENLHLEALIRGPAQWHTKVFGMPAGGIYTGAVADLVLYNYIPPADSGSVALLQAVNSTVAWTIVNGRVVVRDGQLLGTNDVELQREASKAVAAVWGRAH